MASMTTKKTASKEGKGGDSPAQLIDAKIKELGDWRGETLARVRTLIREADPKVVEEWKWGFRCGRTVELSAPSKATPGAPSISMGATRLMKRR
jgi:hypothetical protein